MIKRMNERGSDGEREDGMERRIRGYDRHFFNTMHKLISFSLPPSFPPSIYPCLVVIHNPVKLWLGDKLGKQPKGLGGLFSSIFLPLDIFHLLRSIIIFLFIRYSNCQVGIYKNNHYNLTHLLRFLTI